MKKLVYVMMFLTLVTNAQVGIGTTTPAGALDITATNDGLLIPRIALTNTTTATVLSPTKSELVYNTATAGDVTPGYYYWETTPTVASDRWVRLMTTNTNIDWSITGNSGTTPGTNYIGTSDAQDLRIKTNNTDRLNISNANGQLQSYYAGAAGTPAFSWNSDPNTGIFNSATDNLSIATNGVEGFRVRENSNVSIGNAYASTNAAPNNGLRIQGQTVIGKPSGEDSRDVFSSHTSTASFNNITGYPSVAGKRALAGYADSSGIGVLGFSNSTGFGVVGLTQPSTISAFVQTGEGVLGQADGQSTGIPIGVHGIIDESISSNTKATPVLGENNNITLGLGFSGGAYATNRAIAGVYGNIGSRVTPSTTNAYMFGVVGDILTLGGTIPDGSGGILGAGGSGQFGTIGYQSLSGTLYSVYGGGNTGSINAGNTGKEMYENSVNNHIGLGINGGFMGGYIQGNQYGLISKGNDFGMYVLGNTITNKPIVQLTETNNSHKTVSYTATSTDVDVTTRGTGKLSNGESYITFKEAFKNLISKTETINVTVTPTDETNGVYVSKITSEGFYVRENLKGKSNASFNWTAIGTRSGFENGIEISETILAKDFEKNINGVMNNDGKNEEGTPIYYDGNKIKFERIPESNLKFNKKSTPKENK